MYGSQIGRKFSADGAALRYPGNTVIADVRPGCEAYDTMTRLKAIAADSHLTDCLILLPEDSYHMTVIRGLNDLVRAEDFWPKALDRAAPFDQADEYVQSAMARVGLPKGLSMRFTGVKLNEEDFRVLVAPADDEQEKALRVFRDSAANALGLFLPGHAAYTYHITLAYTRIVPEGEALERARRAIGEMEAVIAAAPPFMTTPPYVAYYDDMLAFSPHKIPRCSGKGEDV